MWGRTDHQTSSQCAMKSDIINNTQHSGCQQAPVVVWTVLQPGDTRCCHHLPASRALSGSPPAAIHHPSWLGSSPNLGLSVSPEPGCPLTPLPPPPRQPPGLCVLKAHSFHSVKNKPACALPPQRHPSPQWPRVGCCCRSTRCLLK